MVYKRALITGASSGIGRETALLLAKSGYDLVLLARRADRLEKLLKEIGPNVKTELVIADVRDENGLTKGFAALREPHSSIDILINNAGLALGTEKLQEAKPKEWNEMIDVNLKGLLNVTHAILPNMIARGRGHIVNIGSVAGRWVYSGGSVYCATKFAVRALSDALRLDLLGTPVRVTNIEPGMVETEFSKVRLRDEKKAAAVYDGMTPLSARDIAECVLWSINRPPHVNIQELVVFPTDQAGVGFVHRNK